MKLEGSKRVLESNLRQGLVVIRQAESPSFTPGGLEQVFIANHESKYNTEQHKQERCKAR
jgi:hypothetical protein